MPKHNFPPSGELTYAANAEDQEKALDECVEWAKTKFALISIIWKERTEVMGKEKHVFTINYTSVIDATSNSHPDVQKS
jgi:hypothetical protein